MTELPFSSKHHSPFSPLRREDMRLLRGEGSFVHDHESEGLLHVAFVRSPKAAGRLLGLDAAPALRMPGVKAVLTARELGDHQMPPVNPLLAVPADLHFPLLAVAQVNHVGQVIALVVARTADQAWRAAQLVVPDISDESTGAGPLADFEPSDNITRVDFQAGSMEGLEVAHEVSVQLSSPRVLALSMEPRASVALWHPAEGSLTLRTGTQAPSRVQHDVARCLGLDREKVRVICGDVGGAFGAKASVYPEDLLLALAARRLQAHLSWVSRRSDEFTSAMHGRGSRMRGALRLDHGGKLLALEADLHFTLGAWMPFSAVVPLRNAARILPGPYQVRSVEVHGRAGLSNAAPVNIYRGAGRPEAALLMECLIERAARKSGIDPVELRRRNLVDPSRMPWTTPSGEVLDSGNYLAALERACERFDYVGARADQACERAGGALSGIGLALYIEPCGQGWESARVVLQADGKVSVATGSPAQGQGHETTYARIAAQALGCDAADVDVICGDTGLCPEGIGALASRSTAIGGSAILKACREVLERRKAGEPLPVTAQIRFSATESWSYGCVIVKMTIDRETGSPSVERVVWVDDAGTVIHPELVKGQLLGGFAQGFGQAMMERLVYDGHGQLQTGSLMDYAIPRAADLPVVEIDSLCTPSPNNLLGAKGVGEAGCIGVPAALMNAAADALSPLGEFDLQFPLTAEQLWRALSAAGTLAA